MSTPKEQNYENLADTLVEAFHRRGIEGFFCPTKEEALQTALGLITPGSTVSWGGSVSCSEIGLFEALQDTDCTLIDRSLAKTPEDSRRIYAETVMSDFYFCSSNAVTLDGELVNIDGNGNRVACLITGPSNVILIVGMNKIVKDVPTAIDRVRNFAAPPNCLRLGLSTPCSKYGHCGDCYSNDCICSQIVITRRSRVFGRIKVILVGEELGY